MIVKELIKLLKNWDENLEVTTESIEDGINRHFDIVGFEDDMGDEYLVIKVDTTGFEREV